MRMRTWLGSVVVSGLALTACSAGSADLGSPSGQSAGDGGSDSGGSGGAGGTGTTATYPATGGSSAQAGSATVTGGAPGAGAGGIEGSASSSGTAGAGSETGSGSASAAGNGGTTGTTGGTGGMAGAATAGTGGTGGAATAGTGGMASGKPCASAADCDDGNYCNGTETCVNGACAPGKVVDCSDLQGCTNDLCDEATKSCKHLPTDALCPTDLCKGTGKCDAQMGCTYAGGATNCDDGIACTADSCDAAKGCVHVANDAACQDANLCNGNEVCDPTSGCKAGPPLVCSDGIACTTDSCDPKTGCAHAPNDALCDDGLFCTGTETCDPKLGCKAGAPVVCATDGIACTVDACDELKKACASTASDQLCPAGQFCKPPAGCKAGLPCTTSAQCNDGDPCNGVEVCGGDGLCAPGAPMVCDDGRTCTADQCVKGTGCVFTPVDSICNDGDFCTGVEKCAPSAVGANVVTGCVAGTLVDCDDGVLCTTDSCSTANATCVHSPVDAACSNGLGCDGAEVCAPGAGGDPVTGCKAGLPKVCSDDGVACTVESCKEPGVCAHTADSTLCPAGLDCVPSKGGCVDTCVVTACQGHVYACGDCIDNDGDGLKDSKDSQCLGPCDNTEASYYGGISGQNNAPCKQDCYFDQDSGAGNDDCHWDHSCDPHEVAPGYAPEGSQCSYNPSTSFAGYTCATAQQSQSKQCSSYCGPLTPNGCDCFGCCELPAGSGHTVWLGSENPKGTGSCNEATVNDPTKCMPCVQVAACLNPCSNCEICIGKPTLPPECTTQVCPIDSAACGLPGQPICDPAFYCVSGCCQRAPT